ncbi:MAG TPA: serine/threonine-protein kinase [Polyangia bacterium]|jgi:hypothetical protein|nr:serine/threonine-protein kinase [Polyangia bacterium]
MRGQNRNDETPPPRSSPSPGSSASLAALPGIDGRDTPWVGQLGGTRYTQTYLVFHSVIGHDVVVEQLRPEVAQDGTLRDRFQRAAEALRRIGHPSIICLFDHDEGGIAGEPRMLLERIQGPSLKEFCKAHGPLSPSIVLSIARILGSALQALHDRGIVHRDITPENIYLDLEHGRLVVAGFLFILVPDTAETPEITRDGEAIGTLGYMAPEQARGEPVDERADIFSFGVLLYELLEGHLPFASDSLEQFLAEVDKGGYVGAEAFDARAHECLVAGIQGCLHSDPEARWHELDELVHTFERGLKDELLADAEVELRRFLTAPDAYLAGLPERRVRALRHKACFSLAAGDQEEAARLIEVALEWHREDPELKAILHALPAATPAEVESLRVRLAPRPKAPVPLPGRAPPDPETVALVPAPAEKPPQTPETPKTGHSLSQRWLHWRRGVVAAVCVLLASTVTGLVALVQTQRYSPVEKAFGAVLRQERPGPVQFTYRLLADYRPYPIERADRADREPEAARRLDLEALDRLEKQGDLHAVCSAWVADGGAGSLEHAQACLDVLAPRTEQPGLVKVSVSPSPAPDVDSDRAAILLLLGKPDQALWLIAGVLASRPDHQAAQWNRALALQALGLPISAAEAFERIEKRGIPGWSKEAGERKVVLERELSAQRRPYDEVIAKGRALVAGGPIPLELAALQPGYLRLFFYDAVRAATDPERVRELLRLAEALDQAYGGNVLANYVKRLLQAPPEAFQRRAPLARTYAKLFADHGALDAQAQDGYFAALRAAGAEDLLLGALLLTGRVREHLAEYRALAQRSGDPWFAVLAETEEANADMARGDERRAEERLRSALETCERHNLAYRYLRTEYARVHLYISQYALQKAEVEAQASLALARKTGDWEAETQFLGNLFEVAQLRNNRPLAVAYLDETGTREAAHCPYRRYVHENRALMYLFDLRFEDARREILQEPLCGEPRTFASLNVMAELIRAGVPVMPLAQLRADLAALHRQRSLGPGDQAFAEYVEGLLSIGHDPQEGRLHFRQAISTVEGMPTWDRRAREAWVHSYEELSLDAGKTGDVTGALVPLAEQARIPLPTQCVLGVVVFGERSLVVMRDGSGGERIRYEGHLTNPNIDLTHLVPDDWKARLVACERVDVLASPLLRGRSEFLPSTLQWVTQARHLVPAQASRCEAHQLEVRDPLPASDFRRPQFSTGKSELLSTVGRTILWGSSATPSALLQEMPRASEILIAAPAFAADSAASLLLSPDKNNKSVLTSEDLQGLELPCAPVVALILSPAEATLLGPHEPLSWADTLIERGARAVFLVSGPVPGSEYRQFFGMVNARINAGAAAAEALDETKKQWVMWNRDQNTDWVDHIVLFQ